MVQIITDEGQALYECEECHFRYRDRVWAQQCQAWCAEHKSCNLEIITHAQQISQAKGGE